MRVAVNPTTIESAPVFAAGERQSGAVELVGGKIPLLLDGTVDAATNAETQALLFSLERPDLRVVLTVSECAYRVVARRSHGIDTPADLSGKTIGTTRQTSAHYFLVELVRRAGLYPPELDIIDVPQDQMPAALADGRIDALAIWEPIAEAAAARIADDAVVFQDGALFRERFNLNTTTAVLNDPRRRAALVGFVRAVIAAAREVAERPQAVWPLLAAKIGLPEATIARLWPQFRFPAALPGDLAPLMIDEERWLAALQKRPPRSAAAVSNLIDPSVLAEALD